jgi:hypothetical protein
MTRIDLAAVAMAVLVILVEVRTGWSYPLVTFDWLAIAAAAAVLIVQAVRGLFGVAGRARPRTTARARAPRTTGRY